MTTESREIALERAVFGLFIAPRGKQRPSTFLSTIYCSLRQSWDDTIPTACVNAKMQLRINATWFLSLSVAMRETLLAHEIWHIALKHVLEERRGKRDPRLWNVACDYVINWMLHEQGFTFDINPLTGKVIGLLDSRFADMTAEQVYDILESENEPIELPFGEDFEIISMSSEEKEIEEDKIAQVLVRAVTLSKLGDPVGSLPEALTTEIERMLNPRLPWELLLSRWLTELAEYGSSWRTPSRRYMDDYLPGRQGDSGLSHLRWYLDSSGSVSDDQAHVYISEAVGAKNTLNPKLMTITLFDDVLHETREFTDADVIDKFEIIGRNGTDLRPVMADIQKHRPDGAVIISDLYCRIPPNPGVPILWVCVDNPKATVPYGTLVHLDSSR